MSKTPSVLILLTALAFAWGCDSSTAPSPDEPASGAAQKPVEPRALYVRSCQSCHGPTGKGNGPRSRGLRNIPDFTSVAWQEGRTDAQLKHTLMEGKGSMPAFKLRYEEPELEALIQVVRGFRP